jgi:hypothetical protein
MGVSYCLYSLFEIFGKGFTPEKFGALLKKNETVKAWAKLVI